LHQRDSLAERVVLVWFGVVPWLARRFACASTRRRIFQVVAVT